MRTALEQVFAGRKQGTNTMVVVPCFVYMQVRKLAERAVE